MHGVKRATITWNGNLPSLRQTKFEKIYSNFLKPELKLDQPCGLLSNFLASGSGLRRQPIQFAYVQLGQNVLHVAFAVSFILETSLLSRRHVRTCTQLRAFSLLS